MAKPAHPFELRPEDRPRAAMLTVLRCRLVLQQSDPYGPMPPLSPREEAVLLILATRAGPHTCGVLSETLRVHKPAITRAVDALERDGLAGRAFNPNDRRTPHYRITPKGIGVVERMCRALADAIAETAPPPAAEAA